MPNFLSRLNPFAGYRDYDEYPVEDTGPIQQRMMPGLERSFAPPNPGLEMPVEPPPQIQAPQYSDSAMNQYRGSLESQPMWEDNRPSKKRTFGGIMLGGLAGMGVNNPQMAYNMSRNIVRAPYENAMDEWKTTTTNYRNAAAIEEAKNKDAYTKYQDTIKNAETNRLNTSLVGYRDKQGENIDSQINNRNLVSSPEFLDKATERQRGLITHTQGFMDARNRETIAGANTRSAAQIAAANARSQAGINAAESRRAAGVDDSRQTFRMNRDYSVANPLASQSTSKTNFLNPTQDLAARNSATESVLMKYPRYNKFAERSGGRYLVQPMEQSTGDYLFGGATQPEYDQDYKNFVGEIEKEYSRIVNQTRQAESSGARVGAPGAGLQVKSPEDQRLEAEARDWLKNVAKLRPDEITPEAIQLAIEEMQGDEEEP